MDTDVLFDNAFPPKFGVFEIQDVTQAVSCHFEVIHHFSRLR